MSKIKFSGLAYSGKTIEYYYYPVVIDLSDLEIPNSLPILLNHNPDRFIGRGVARVEDNQLFIEGDLDSELAADVIKAAGSDFPWQMSVGVNGSVKEAGGDEIVNGHPVEKGTLIMTRGRLREVSAVPTGADHRTEMKIAAGANESIFINFEFKSGGNKMSDEVTEIKDGDVSENVAEKELGADMASIEADATVNPAHGNNAAVAVEASHVDAYEAETREKIAALKAELAALKIEAAVAKHCSGLPESVVALIKAAAESDADVAEWADKVRNDLPEKSAEPVNVKAGFDAGDMAALMKKFIKK